MFPNRRKKTVKVWSEREIGDLLQMWWRILSEKRRVETAQRPNTQMGRHERQRRGVRDREEKRRGKEKKERREWKTQRDTRNKETKRETLRRLTSLLSSYRLVPSYHTEEEELWAAAVVRIDRELKWQTLRHKCALCVRSHWRQCDRHYKRCPFRSSWSSFLILSPFLSPVRCFFFVLTITVSRVRPYTDNLLSWGAAQKRYQRHEIII